jgi:L-aspartate oxidase
MLGVHPLAELAPRDIVSREIESVMARCGRPNVWLDARHLGAAHLRERFPTIWETCAEAGFDLARDLVPVAPAAHYMVGGVLVDIDGQTTLPGLYASGEVTSSGLHGANRLASNSLLEGLVFSRRIVRALASTKLAPRSSRIAVDVPGDDTCGTDLARVTIQNTMSTSVGMTRTEEGLATACAALADLEELLGGPAVDAEAMESRNMATVAGLIANAARHRRESRGTHYRADFPLRDDEHWRFRLAWRRSTDAPREIPVSAAPEAGAVGLE